MKNSEKKMSRFNRKILHDIVFVYFNIINGRIYCRYKMSLCHHVTYSNLKIQIPIEIKATLTNLKFFHYRDRFYYI